MTHTRIWHMHTGIYVRKFTRACVRTHPQRRIQYSCTSFTRIHVRTHNHVHLYIHSHAHWQATTLNRTEAYTVAHVSPHALAENTRVHARSCTYVSTLTHVRTHTRGTHAHTLFLLVVTAVASTVDRDMVYVVGAVAIVGQEE